MQKKKTGILILVAVAVCVLIGGFAFMANAGNQKEAVAKSFLTEIYTVKDHSRYQTLKQKLDVIPLEGTEAGINNAAREAAHAVYKTLFDPLTTDSGFEQITANVDYLRAETFAMENKYLFEVKSITLKSNYADKEMVQYDYTVVITATPESGAAPTDITGEGNLVVMKDEDGVFRVNSFKPFDRGIYEKLIGS